MKRNVSVTVAIICTVFMVICLSVLTNRPVSKKKDETVDYDLSFMNKSMAYSTLGNIKAEPQNYVGKSIKIVGRFCNCPNAPQGEERPSVLLYDGNGCCFTCIEILLNGKSYPKAGTQINLVGTLEIFYRDEQEYCRIVN